MKKKDYKSEFEEHRQEIKLDDGNGPLPSRAELHRKARKPKKKSRHKIINVILVLFTLVPVIILSFVISNFYTPEEDSMVKVEDSKIQFETSKNALKEDAKEKVANADSEPTESDKNTLEIEPEPVTKPEPDTQPVIEPEQDVKPDPQPVTKPEKKPETKPDPKPAVKSHKVAPGENLYRISLKHYNSGDGVNKIIQANGLSSNEIVVGQTLIIP